MDILRKQRFEFPDSFGMELVTNGVICLSGTTDTESVGVSSWSYDESDFE